MADTSRINALKRAIDYLGDFTQLAKSEKSGVNEVRHILKDLVAEVEQADKDPFLKYAMAMNALKEVGKIPTAFGVHEPDGEVQMVMVLCNSHIAEDTSHWLTDRASGHPILENETLIVVNSWSANGEEYGWMIYLFDEHDGDRSDWPDDLITVYDYAKLSGAKYLHLDRDAQPIATLPTFDW